MSNYLTIIFILFILFVSYRLYILNEKINGFYKKYQNDKLCKFYDQIKFNNKQGELIKKEWIRHYKEYNVFQGNSLLYLNTITKIFDNNSKNVTFLINEYNRVCK